MPTKSELENRIEQIDEILGVLQEIRDAAVGELEQLVKVRQETTLMVPIDFKDAINQDIKEIDLALSVLNSLRDVNLARLALLQEAEKRSSRG